MRKGGAKFWAWMVSIVVHLVVLTAFGIIKFSQEKLPSEQMPAPVAKVNRVKELMYTAAVTPKPKVKKLAKGQAVHAAATPAILKTEQIFKTEKPNSSNLSHLAKPSDSQNIPLQASGVLPGGTEFFGSYTNQRKLCYVVDCSGSMHGIFSRVQKELIKSVQSLQQDQYFYIIFFGGDRLFEFGNGVLLRATQKNKADACVFINYIIPEGQTNAMEALERAVMICDARGDSPSVIYFLTDGFELTNDDVQEFSQKVINLQKKFVPKTKINTIGFWPQTGDRKVLNAIASQSGGQSVFITDSDGWKGDW